MLIKYRTFGGRLIKILPIKAERETESSVWINGRRRLKQTDWDNHHDTWEHAQNYLITRETTKVTNCQSALDSAKARLSEIRKLEKYLTVRDQGR